MRWYVSANVDELGTPYEAPSAVEAVERAARAGAVPSGAEVTVRHDVKLIGRGPEWWYAAVETLKAPGTPAAADKAKDEADKKAKAEADKKAKADADAKAKAEADKKAKAEADATSDKKAAAGKADEKKAEAKDDGKKSKKAASKK